MDLILLGLIVFLSMFYVIVQKMNNIIQTISVKSRITYKTTYKIKLTPNKIQNNVNMNYIPISV